MVKKIKKVPPRKIEITREGIKEVIGGAKFKLDKMVSGEWAAYRLQVEGLPEGIVTVTLGEEERALYDKVIRICRENTHKGLPIIRGTV